MSKAGLKEMETLNNSNNIYEIIDWVEKIPFPKPEIMYREFLKI